MGDTDTLPREYDGSFDVSDSSLFAYILHFIQTHPFVCWCCSCCCHTLDVESIKTIYGTVIYSAAIATWSFRIFYKQKFVSIVSTWFVLTAKARIFRRSLLWNGSKLANWSSESRPQEKNVRQLFVEVLMGCVHWSIWYPHRLFLEKWKIKVMASVQIDCSVNNKSLPGLFSSLIFLYHER